MKLILRIIGLIELFATILIVVVAIKCFNLGVIGALLIALSYWGFSFIVAVGVGWSIKVDEYEKK